MSPPSSIGSGALEADWTRLPLGECGQGLLTLLILVILSCGTGTADVKY